MLVFNEGVPGSGKSYDAVAAHILPALNAGRRVYARLNGLNLEAIADYLAKPLSFVESHLFHVETADVVFRFRAEQDQETGKWQLPADFKNALIVIDEVHEFYVGQTRVPMDPASEQFFALHRHFGVDIVVISQFYKRVHQAVRMRVERKNSFQKLSALGKKGERMYLVTFSQTVAPDRYEKVGTATRTYDPKIFPLYAGISGGVDGDVNAQVYTGGRTSVWKSMAIRAAIILPIGIFSVWYLLDFFVGGGGTKLVKQTKPTSAQVSTVHPTQSVADGDVYQPDVPVTSQAAAPPAKAEPTQAQIAQQKRAAMPVQVRYLFDLADKARPRLAVRFQRARGEAGLVEFVDSSGAVLERLSVDAIKALGFAVSWHEYGLLATASDQEMVVTAWPLNLPLREERPMLYDTSGGGDRAVSVSEPHGTAAASHGASVSVSMPTGIGNGNITASDVASIGGVK